MPFNDKQDIKLIRAVKENELLYDVNHPQYTDFNTREVVWQKIGDQLHCTASECKGRWVNIRDINRRNMKKQAREDKKVQRYKYANELTFLKPYYKDISLREDESDYADYETCDFEEVDIENQIIIEHKPKRAKRDLEDQSQIENIDVSAQVDTFLLSIGTTLKKFSPYHLNLAKSQIFAVVQDHELQQIVRQKDEHHDESGDIAKSSSY